MLQTAIIIFVFVAVLALLPFTVKWIQRRMQAGTGGLAVTSKVISVVAVGPQQRVVTVEVGPVGARVWLVLGVTAQSVTCLYKLDSVSGAELQISQEDASAPMV